MNRLALATGLALAIAVLGALSPAFDGPARASLLPQASPQPLESAIIEIQEGPGASATPTDTPSPSPTPTRAPRKRGKSNETPEPTDTPTPEPTPGASESPTPLPVASPTATPSPSAPSRPTLQPVAVRQLTIPQSLADPGARDLLRRPISQLRAFAWLTGTWRAQTIEQSGDGQQHDLGTNIYVFAQTMKGRWIFGADGKATDYFYITYDPFAEHWILVRMNATPAYGVWTSDRGWQRNSIEFTSVFSYATGRPYRRRITIVQKDAKNFKIYDEEQLSDGSWTGDDSVSLTKQ